MEVLSARMTPGFKGEDGSYYKRMYDGNTASISHNPSKHSRKGELKLDHRAERTVYHETTPMRESAGQRKVYAGGSQGWDGGSRKFMVPRPVGRPCHHQGGTTSASNQRRVSGHQESSDDAETSQDNVQDDSETSGDDEAAPPQAIETPQTWPIIQIVDPPAWLPEGWTAVLRTRESGSKDKYYVDPVSQRRFRSKTEVNYYLQTGKSYRYKRNLALLTKPLKEDPVSLPNTVQMRNVNLDVASSRENLQALPFVSPSYVEHRGMGAPQSRPVQGPDVSLSMGLSGVEPMKVTSVRNKPGPKPRVREDESGRPHLATASKRSLAEERKAPDVALGTENRGKLILKLKRKTSELDEGQKNGKKPRPFQVVGAGPAQRSRSSTSSEGDRHQRLWSMDHSAESARMHVTPVQPARKPGKGAPVWHFPPVSQHPGPSHHPICTGNAPFNAPGGSGHPLERTSGSVTLSVTDSENAKFSHKRESPAEQLQRLGRRLCQQAVKVLTSNYGGINTLQQINQGLGLGMNSGYNASHGTSLTPNFSDFSPSYSRGFITPAASAHFPQQQPPKRMRGSLQKEKNIMPVQKYGLDHHYMHLPQSA
ncbi:hypothetical protein R1sor_010450 [Riccia sorocarpa]|uniref:MBD domain-containing protein n=1 Tax=Riccia sorocarpa TaxID=122646 RepID=A0ABD3I1H9_9MARC